jgi:hypothetical protein
MSGELVANLGLWIRMIGNLDFFQHYAPSDFSKFLFDLLVCWLESCLDRLPAVW